MERGYAAPPGFVEVDDFGLGQHSGNSSGARRRHRLGHLVQPVAEEVPVLVQRHRRRGVPEHLLNDLHVGAGGDGQGRRGVPQFVGIQARQPDRRRGLVEGGTPLPEP